MIALTFLKQFDIIFYCSSYVDEIWCRSTLQYLNQYNIKQCLVIQGNLPDHLRFYYKNSGIKVKELNNTSQLKKIKSTLVVSASTNLLRHQFSKKVKKIIHMPHSIASLHGIYPADAFDVFDCLFAVGKHHIEEFNAIIEQRNLKERKSYAVGYGKLDILLDEAKTFLNIEKNHILIAPSWGEHNLIDTMGAELIGKLLNKGYKITLRPHPMFYFDKKKSLEPILDIKHDNFFIEHPSEKMDSLYRSDTMITDYSGVAFEYALIKKRPIIFVDFPPKILNTEFNFYTSSPIEINKRSLYGQIVKPNIDAVIKAVKLSIARLDETDLIFNPGACGKTASRLIREMLK